MGNTKSKIKNYGLIALICAVCVCVCLCAGVFFAPRVSAATVEISASDALPDSACVDSAIKPPASVSVSLNGKNYTATDGVVIQPDGKIISVPGELALTQTGEYVVKYFFSDGNVKHTALKKINVYSSYYSFTAGTSSLTLSGSGAKLESEKDGAVILLKDGDTFVYSKPVDLKNAGDDGLTSVIELDGRLGHFVTDEKDNKKYVSEAGVVWVRLTDCYNSNLYAELRIGRSAAYQGTMFTGVRTSYQKCSGLDKGSTHSSTRSVVIDGVQYGFWYNESGYMSTGMPNMEANMTTGFVWKYDYEKMRFYVSYNNGEEHLVTDLDDTVLYPDAIFPGWTTGEVFVSIYGEDYLESEACVDLISIGDDDVYSVINGEYSDEVAPVITVNAKKSNDEGIYGAIGDTIIIPDAEAKDVNLVGDVSVAVYRGYGTEYASGVSVQNGTFVLAENEAYSIVYSAKDAAGNVGTSVYKVIAKKGVEKRAIALEAVKPDKLIAGVPAKLGYEITQNLNGEISDVNVKITVSSARQSVELGEEGTFIPSYAESYAITYSYEDGIYSYQKTYSLDCEAQAGVVSFDGEITLPQTFIKGFYYSLPKASAYKYDNGYPEEAEVKVYAVYDGGAETLISDINRVQITGNSAVKFIYKTEGAEPKETQEISIVSVATDNEGEIDAAHLFTGDFEVDSYKLKFTSKKSSGNNTLSFVNAVSARSFQLKYRIEKGDDNFDTLRVTFTDYADPSVKFTITVDNKEDGAYVSINGATAKLMDDEVFGFAGDGLTTISYSHSKRDLKACNASYFEDIDFPSGKAYLSIEMLGIHGNSAIEISQINNQPFGQRVLSSDSASPEIYFKDNQGEYAKGETVKIYTPEFSDVISGVDYSTASLTISGSNGVVYDSQGKELKNLDWTKEYEILMDDVAKFTVTYSVKDFSGRNASSVMIIKCVDTTAPTITLTNMKEGATVYIKAGEEVTICFSIADDVTPAVSMVAYVHLYCDDLYSYVSNVTNIDDAKMPLSGKFEAKFSIAVRGNYTAKINCYDEAGNRAVTEVKIVVE